MRSANSLQVIRGAEAATLLLQPTRRLVLEHLAEPQSAAGLARRLGLPRQKLNYHLRELEREGLAECVEERRKGNCTERLLRATARAFVISPEALGALGPTLETAADRFSADYLIAAASRTVRDLAAVAARAAAQGKRVATFTIEADVRFAGAEARAAFAQELTGAVAALVARYNDEAAPGGRRFHLLAAIHPVLSPDASAAPQESPREDAPAVQDQEEEMSEKTRRFEMSLDIEASPEDVWRALTEKGELVRWFPLNAEVVPGKGGSIFWSWGEAWPWKLDIADWQPGRRLLLHQPPAEYHQYDAEGRARPESPKPQGPIAVEFTLEKEGSGTRLRLVHSGFGPGAEWDDEFDGISHGWPFELRGLRHYLERHRGRDRHAAMVRASTALSIPESWTRLIGPGGYGLQPEAPTESGSFSATTASGETYAGTVALLIPQRELFGVVPQLADAQFRLSTHRAAGQTGVLAWLAVWGAPRPEVERFQASAEILGALFTA